MSTQLPLSPPAPAEERAVEAARASGDHPVVQLRSVSKAYDLPDGGRVDVLEDVDLSLEPGEHASLVGPSGSGKSTLLSVIAGLLRATSGTVSIDGTVVSDLDDRGRARIRAQRIGIALQSDNLVPFLSARENVELAARLGRQRRGEASARAVELLELFGVAHRADRQPRHLSGGEAQRVALAVALANDPALLLADEVVAQLDADTAGAVLGELLHGRLAVLLVTHDRQLADRMATRYELRDRRVVRR